MSACILLQRVGGWAAVFVSITQSQGLVVQNKGPFVLCDRCARSSNPQQRIAVLHRARSFIFGSLRAARTHTLKAKDNRLVNDPHLRLESLLNLSLSLSSLEERERVSVCTCGCKSLCSYPFAAINIARRRAIPCLCAPRYRRLLQGADCKRGVFSYIRRLILHFI